MHQHFASPTRLTALRDLVAQDMKDRGEWLDRCKKNEKERYKRENRQDEVSCRMAAKERKERKTDSFFVFLAFYPGRRRGRSFCQYCLFSSRGLDVVALQSRIAKNGHLICLPEGEEYSGYFDPFDGS